MRAETHDAKAQHNDGAGTKAYTHIAIIVAAEETTTTTTSMPCVCVCGHNVVVPRAYPFCSSASGVLPFHVACVFKLVRDVLCVRFNGDDYTHRVRVFVSVLCRS